VTECLLRVVVVQKGAREHFLAASALHRHGMLAGLCTDWYAPQSTVARGVLHLLGRRNAASARAAACREIPRGMVRSFPFRSLLWRWRVRQWAAQGRLYEAYAQTDAAFARAVAQCHLPPHGVFFGYSYASLEVLQSEKSEGKMTILDQIDPGPAHFQLVAAEMARHPELAGAPQISPAAYFSRVRQEWGIADVIVVNSEWSREALLSEGVNPAKIEILPLAYEPRDEGQRSEVSGQSSGSPRSATLRVLFLGQVTPGKGIHYLMEAAKLLQGAAVHFDVVGTIGILPGALASAPRNLIFHGPVSRDSATEWYRQSDVFALPTLSDGFAITQLEALAHGLPVITTPNCGRVVEDGKTGFLVPACDAIALAGAISKFLENRQLAEEMRSACRAASKARSLEKYGLRLIEIINRGLALRAAKPTPILKSVA